MPHVLKSPLTPTAVVKYLALSTFLAGVRCGRNTLLFNNNASGWLVCMQHTVACSGFE